MRASIVFGVVVLALVAGIAWFALREDPATPPLAPGGATTASAQAPEDSVAAKTARARAAKRREVAGAGTVIGLLREHGSDRPLAGVPVELTPDPETGADPLRGTSAADGSFHFERVPALAGWTFHARVQEPKIHLEQAGVNVVADRTTDLGVVYAVAPLSFGGIVVDAKNAPVEGAAVRVLRPFQFGKQSGMADMFTAFLEDPAAADTATSGKDGRFRLSRTPPGTFDIVADHPAHSRGVERVSLAPGATPPDLRIVLAEGFEVAGQIVRADGGKLAGHKVKAMQRDGLMANPFQAMARLQSATSDETGTFRFKGLTRGSWTAIVLAEGEMFPDQMPFEVPYDGTLEIKLGGDAWLTGKVSAPDGKPVAGARIIVNAGARAGIAATGPDGHYELRGLSSGTKVGVMVEARGYVTHGSFMGMGRMMGGSEDDTTLQLVAGLNERDVTLSEGGTLKGRVVEKGGERGLEGVRVMLRGGGFAAVFGGASTFSDATGAFELKGLANGSHTASLEKRGWSTVGSDEDGANPFAGLMAAAMNGGKADEAAEDTGTGLTIVVKDDATVQRVLEMERAATLAGRVIDPQGAGIPGAKVKASAETDNPLGFDMAEMMSSMLGGDDGSVVTDGSGGYELTVKPAKGFKVTASAQGFVEAKTESVKGDAGIRVQVADLTLSRGATVSGAVTDADGKPVADCDVSLDSGANAMFGMAARFMNRGAPTAKTDAEGKYRVTGVAAGTVSVVVKHEGFRESTTSDIAVAADATVTVDVVLDRGVSVTGVVLGPAGTPLAGASVRCSAAGGRGRGMGMGMFGAKSDTSGSASTGKDGTFSISGLAPGSYEVRANAKGMLTNEPVVTAAGSPCTIRLAEALRIAGFVRCEGRPVAGVRVTAEPEGASDPMARMRARMAAIEDSVASGDMGGFNVTTKTDGSFEIPGLRPGLYVVSVGAGDGAAGIQPTKLEGVQGGAQGLVVDCKPGMEIAGTVVLPDGTIAKDGTVRAVQVRDPSNIDVAAMTDTASSSARIQNGAFRIGGLPPGKFQLTVDVTGFSGAPISADAGARNVQFRLIASGTVTGKVVADGKPVGFAMVRVSAPKDRPEAGDPGVSGMTNAKGEFTLKGVPPGDWRVVVARVGAGGMREAEATVTVRANETSTLPEIALGASKAFEIPKPDDE